MDSPAEVLIKETKTIKLSTQSSSGICLNEDPNYKSSFQYTIPPINFHDEDIQYAYYSVNHAIIPVSFYNINYTNNRLDLAILSDEGYLNVSYAFEYGNYNAMSFMTKFKSVLGENWTITLDSISNCFTIMTSLNTFKVLSSSTIGSIMGFSETLNSDYIFDTTFSNRVVFPRVCNFLPIPRIHLHCHHLANSLLLNRITDQGDILCTVPNDSKLNGVIVFHGGKTSTLIDAPFLQTFVINITDEGGNLINFNGISSYFELSIEIYRKRPDIPRMNFRSLIRELSKILD